MKKPILLAFLLLLVTAFTFAQSRETGAITGKVADEQGNPLPGVNLTLSGEKLMGGRAVVSNANGDFRFPALPPGVYSVKAELQGFGTLVQENIRLTTTTTLTLTVTLKLATVQEQVTVIAKSPTVDVKSTETASVTLGNEILRNIPNSQFSANIVMMAPGVNDNLVAYGAGGERGINYQMDGVGVGDPDGGTAWVFVDYNIIEEAKVMGIGLPAEYGNFTGVIFNIVTKSGGNAFSGHFETIYQGYKTGFWGTHNNKAYFSDYVFPDPNNPDVIPSAWPYVTSPVEALWDINGHLGGPIIKDKLWFFAGAQFYRSKDYPTGFPFPQDYKQPRFFLKLSSQLSAKTNAFLAVEWDNYNGTYRNAGESSSLDPIATTRQIDPEIVLDFSLTHVLSSKTFFDVKAAYFNGYYNLDPMSGNRDIPGHYINKNILYNPADTAPPSLSDPGTLSPRHRYFNVWSFEEHPRDRFQANASMTTYAEDFIKGSHDFKFGVEFEQSHSRNLYRYTGATHMYYYDVWDGYYYGNYSANQYFGYNAKMKMDRLEGFAQDSWRLTKRLNLSLGVRLSQEWGSVPNLEGTPYSKFRAAPRLGFTFDLLGDKTTIIKGHYGEFTDGMYAGMIDRLNSDWSDKIFYYWDQAGSFWYEYNREVHGTYVIDPQIKHPFMRQFTIGVERELFKDASFSVTYINRTYHNFQGAWNALATYDPVDITYSVWDPASRTLVDKTFTLYNLTSGSAAEWHLTDVALIANRLNALYPGLNAKPYRKYWGLEFLFNKRFSNRWQMVASYVYSRATGTMGNSSAYRDIGWNSYYDPNMWVNLNGHVTNDPTHMVKIQASYVLPFDISLSAYFHAITGEAYTQQKRSARGDFDQGRVTFNVQPSGTYHYPIVTSLDLRLEKTCRLATRYRIGGFVDVFNVFNDHTITSWGTRVDYDWYPDVSSYAPLIQNHDLLGMALPRRARLGLRFIF